MVEIWTKPLKVSECFPGETKFCWVDRKRKKEKKNEEKHGNKRREENERKSFLYIFRSKKDGKIE